MDVEAKNPNDRALTPNALTSGNIADMPNPGLDPSTALPVAVAGISPFTPDDHKHIQMLTDHTPVEPYSPEHYVRTFLEGEECWLDRQCAIMRTEQDLIKENLLMTIPYAFPKDFRWIDLNVNEAESEPRWGLLNAGLEQRIFQRRKWKKSYPTVIHHRRRYSTGWPRIS